MKLCSQAGAAGVRRPRASAEDISNTFSKVKFMGQFDFLIESVWLLLLDLLTFQKTVIPVV